MYRISAESRMLVEIFSALDKVFGPTGDLMPFRDDSGRLFVEVEKGFPEVVEKVEPGPDKGVAILGGGFMESLDGKKFEVIVKKVDDK